ncbi:MAG: ABC transporter ATP-binding protein [Magnetococcales bacterium]|nr:ABC transporter ATP-binding protein [Magnetococcales bacterium]
MMPAVDTVTEETRFGASFDLKLMLRFLAYAKPYRLQVIVAFALLPVAAGVQMVQPLVIKEAVDHHLLPNNLVGFDRLLWIMGGLIATQFFFGFLQSVVNALLGQRIIRDLRRDLFTHLLALDASYFARTGSGRLTNRLANDAEAVSQMISAGFIHLAGDLLLLLTIAVSMAILSPGLSLLLLAAAPPIAWFTARIARRMRVVQKEGRLLQSRMAGRMAEEIEGRAVVRLFHRQERNRQAFDRLNRDYLKTAVEANYLEAWQFTLVEASATMLTALLFLHGAWLSGSDPVSLGTLVAFIDYLRRIFLPIRDLSSKFTTMQAAMTALERIFDLLETPAAVAPPRHPQPLPAPVRGEVRFRDVAFDYGREPVLRGIDFTLRPGEKVAVVGPTGAGKSTIIRLLNRTHDVLQGAVELDGVDLRALDPAELRRRVGVIPQETFLFAGTIADNIGLQDPSVAPEAIRQAAEAAGAMRFIDLLPQGLETPLLERGVNLSAGQRQLLGIARALAFDPAVLALDEATSSVDQISERWIQEALHRLLQGRTALIVAHRLSTILDADRILVLSRGRIVEQGNHAALMAQNGIYAKLYALQFMAEADPVAPLLPGNAPLAAAAENPP